MSQQNKTAVPTSSLMLGVKELYATGIYSDLTISCGARTFKVHKSILHPQSSVFRTLLSGNFKEASPEQGTITLNDDDPKVLQVLLHHLYNFTFDDRSRGAEAEAPFAVRVYAIADKYDVSPLRAMAAQKLTSVADPGPEGLENFIAAIYAIDECCNPKDATLWNIVSPKIVANIDALADDERFFALIQELPALNKALLKRKSITGGGMAEGWEGAEEDGQEYPDDQYIGTYRGRGGHHLGSGRRLG
ncbi:hypothetical protein LTR85_010934 [Meristemomyces frigidus]|nr:hypothetical protein LTR85_010934 [Meristemomyces frigidus]